MDDCGTHHAPWQSNVLMVVLKTLVFFGDFLNGVLMFAEVFSWEYEEECFWKWVLCFLIFLGGATFWFALPLCFLFGTTFWSSLIHGLTWIVHPYPKPLVVKILGRMDKKDVLRRYVTGVLKIHVFRVL